MNEIIVTFKFYRFNSVRKERGAQAAQLEVLEDGESVGLY